MSYNAKPIFFLNSSNALPIINKFIKGFIENYWLTYHNFKDSLILYHYTTLEGLKGILQSRSIWSNHISTLNDPSELKYGQQLVTNILKNFLNDEDDIIIKKILEDLINYVTVYDSVLYQTYISCFCEDNNLLSQWRGYTSKNGGYNIGFDFDDNTMFSHKLEDLNDNSYVILRKVIYSHEKQKEIAQNYISGLIKTIKQSKKNHTEDSFDVGLWSAQVAMNSSNVLFDMIFSFKNEAFKEEREWRLIKAMASDHHPELLKFRDNNERLIPYLETYLFKNLDDGYFLPLKSIRFGPMLNPVSTKSSLEVFLYHQSTIEKNIKIKPIGIKIEGAGYSIRI